MNLKRLWDTENKKIVWAIPTGDPHTKLQVWTNDDGSKLYVYTGSAFRELSLASATVSEYGPVWKALDDETVGYYLTNVPTDLYNWDEGEDVAYAFKNGTTVLQSGKVKEGETPEYTGDTPTKSATAQYTYTFSGWKPTVGPIYKKTDFKAQFDSEVNIYDITIFTNDRGYGRVSEYSVTDIPYGTKLSTDDNVLTIGEGTSAVEVTATANDGYVFSSWGDVPAIVTDDTSITATFGFGPLQNYVLADLENSNSLFTFGDPTASNYVQICTETDEESGDNIVVVYVGGLFNDSKFVGTYGEEDQNGWEYIFYEAFEAESLGYLISEGEAATDGEWKSGVWSALQTYYATPTEANADAVITAIEATLDDGKLEPIDWTIPEPDPE